ncbi:hypothetical protein Hamer_G016198 [Homarus americanus]|uniref:Uncharacterized protein n=1 Tax=Homarus americanus TaxID=6706 RepID=A0A8J5N028_HOMAM|nr:hypothetical protein Hamer_G016198 [Homarus americanus]
MWGGCWLDSVWWVCGGGRVWVGWLCEEQGKGREMGKGIEGNEGDK